MNNIELPSRGLKNKLIFIKSDENFNIYQLDTQIKINDESVYSVHFENDEIIAIDPDSGPFIGIGYKINDMTLDHIDKQGYLYFRR